MIKFKKIKVRNYKSIKNAELLYKEGVWVVKGTNTDTVFKSNGAGKSTILEALHQGLYNANPKGIKIEDTYNRESGKPYRIEITLTKEQDNYTIINDRSQANTIQIFKNGKDLKIKGAIQGLAKVTEIIGYSFKTFCILTYVSHGTIVNMLENFSSSDLMKVVLDFDAIQDFNTKTKNKLKEVKTSIDSKEQSIRTTKESLELLSEFKYEDTTPLITQLALAQTKLNADIKALRIDALDLQLAELNDYCSDARARINEIRSKLENTCSECGAELTKLSDEEVKELLTEDAELNREMDNWDAEITRLTVNISNAHHSKTLLESVYNDYRDKINSQLTVQEYKNEIYEQKKGSIDKLREQLQQETKELKEDYFEQDVYNAVISTIKTGDMHKGLLDNFTKLLNVYLEEYSKHLSIDFLNIRSKALKDKIEFVVHDSRSKRFIPYSTLSGGELTRVRLLVLLSMLRSIQTLSQNSLNVLILDEALDTLDKSASQDLSNLFSHLVQDDDKFIAMVSHGEQLNCIDFNGSIRAVKVNNCTEIRQELL